MAFRFADVLRHDRRWLLVCAVSCIAAPVRAQTRSLTRVEAVQAATDSGARLGLVRMDTVDAAARLVAAKVRHNPELALDYSRDIPHYHAFIGLPFDLPRSRKLRIRAAESNFDAADLRFQLGRATIALDADIAYTKAIAARQHLALARRNSEEADSLLRIVEEKRAADKATELDLETARLNAGLQTDAVVADSLKYMLAVLDLQGILGVTADRVVLRPTDSLTVPPDPPTPGKTLSVTASEYAVQAATSSALFERRWFLPQPALFFGLDWGDPEVKGIEPAVGLAVGLPLLNRNRDGKALADAEVSRAQAELALAKLDAERHILRATREREVALSGAKRDQTTMIRTSRIAAMALESYREGKSSLSIVMTAQKNARETVARYIEDLEDAWVATAELRLLALQPTVRR